MKHKGFYAAWLLFLFVVLALGAWLLIDVARGALPGAPGPLTAWFKSLVTAGRLA